MHDLEADQQDFPAKGPGEHERPQMAGRGGESCSLQSGNGQQGGHEQDAHDLQVHAEQFSPKRGAGSIANLVEDDQPQADDGQQDIDGVPPCRACLGI